MKFDISTFNLLRTMRKVVAVRETSGSASAPSGSWVTLVSMTGKAWITMLRLTRPQAASGAQFRITVDGGTPVVIGSALPFVLDSSMAEVRLLLPIVNLRVDSSLLIEFMQTSGSTSSASAYVEWGER